MRKRYEIWLIFGMWLFAGAGDVMGQAAAQPSAAKNETMDAAKAAMSALAFQYEQAISLQVTCTLSQPVGAHAVDSVQILAAAQKPNLYMLRVSRRGALIGIMACDGLKERFSNPATGRSTESDAPTTQQLVQPSASNAMRQTRMNQVFGNNELVMLQAKSVIAPLFINMLPRPAPDNGKSSQHYFLTKTRLRGISVTKVDDVVPLNSETGPSSSEASVSEAYLNDATGLPIRILLSMIMLGKKTELYRVDYQTLHLKVVPLPSSAFAWVPNTSSVPQPKLP